MKLLHAPSYLRLSSQYIHQRLGVDRDGEDDLRGEVQVVGEVQIQVRKNGVLHTIKVFFNSLSTLHLQDIDFCEVGQIDDSIVQ